MCCVLCTVLLLLHYVNFSSVSDTHCLIFILRDVCCLSVWQLLVLLCICYISCLQLLPRLQEVVQRREETGNPIDLKLKQVADELHSAVVAYLQVGNTCFPFAEGTCRDKCGCHPFEVWFMFE